MSEERASESSKGASGSQASEDLLAKSYFEEYKSLKAEQRRRLEAQERIISYIMLFLAAIIAATIPLFVNKELTQAQIVFLLLMTPTLSSPLVFAYLVNERIVMTIGGYINHELRKNFKNMAGKDAWEWEDYHQKTAKSPSGLLLGFFSKAILILPTVIPILAYLYLVPRELRNLASLPSVTIYLLALDALVIVVVVVSMIYNSYLFINITRHITKR